MNFSWLLQVESFGCTLGCFRNIVPLQWRRWSRGNDHIQVTKARRQYVEVGAPKYFVKRSETSPNRRLSRNFSEKIWGSNFITEEAWCVFLFMCFSILEKTRNNEDKSPNKDQTIKEMIKVIKEKSNKFPQNRVVFIFSSRNHHVLGLGGVVRLKWPAPRMAIGAHLSAGEMDPKQQDLNRVRILDTGWYVQKFKIIFIYVYCFFFFF